MSTILSGTTATPSLSAPAASSDATPTFTLPPHTNFPPFYTLQPNSTTQTHQLSLWSALILSYCSAHQIWRLNLSSPPEDLFTNSTINRSLKSKDMRTVLTHMSTSAGGSTIEFLLPASKGEQSNTVLVWWKSASEWADEIYGWVDGTGQKGGVLTIYELRDEEEGRRSWAGMDEGMLRKVLNVLVKRGRAQIFAAQGGDGEGVKFF